MRLMQRSSVLLPQPEGPIRAVTRLLGMSSETSPMACFLPYQRLTLRIWTAAGPSAGVGAGGARSSVRTLN